MCKCYDDLYKRILGVEDRFGLGSVGLSFIHSLM